MNRQILKRIVLVGSIGYFVFIGVLVAIEQAKGIQAPYNPGMCLFTLLAAAGIVWGLRKDKPEGE
jgi:hypothetical protein